MVGASTIGEAVPLCGTHQLVAASKLTTTTHNYTSAVPKTEGKGTTGTPVKRTVVIASTSMATMNIAVYIFILDVISTNVGSVFCTAGTTFSFDFHIFPARIKITMYAGTCLSSCEYREP